MAASPRIEPPKATIERSDSTSNQPSHNASPKSLQPDQGSREGSPDHEQDYGQSIKEGKCNVPRASLALGRYLAHPQSHEIRALGLATSTALPGRRPTTPEKLEATESPQSPHSPIRDGATPHDCDGTKASPTECYTESLIDPDVSISLSPSPPACSSPEYDAETDIDVRGLATKLKRERESRSGRGRVHKVMKKRRRAKHDKNC